MEAQKSIIFHIPLELDPSLKSASQIRPHKMIQGFKEVGYDVDVIEGSTKQRAKKIKEIKHRIKHGEQFEFVYSESSTMPTMLTSHHHLPLHPWLDFGFFDFCKNHGIKIGLFYRDIYWAFPEYSTGIKSSIAKLFYRLDLKLYNKYVDSLFLPSIRMREYIPCELKMPIYPLPSGAEIVELCDTENNKENAPLEIFYVGGIGNHYNLTLLCKCVAQTDNVHLTICCRPSDWAKIEEVYKPLLAQNIEIVHASGSELDKYYQRADICSLFVEPGVYWAFAMPYKLLEFIGRGKPVLASAPTATSDFVLKNKVGYSLEYKEEELLHFLRTITKSELRDMADHVYDVADKNSWKNRAKEVAMAIKNS